MAKNQYKSHILNAISVLGDKLDQSNKRKCIEQIYNYINEREPITGDKTSYYNTIYYFLRKNGIFSSDKVRYRFDSSLSKNKFISELRNDISNRDEFYIKTFFSRENFKPIDDEVTAHIIDSGIGLEYDFLYTMLYFRDTKKIIQSDYSSSLSYRRLNDNLYNIFNSLYLFQKTIDNLFNQMSSNQVFELKNLIVDFFNFLGNFDNTDYNKLKYAISRENNLFKKFFNKDGLIDILSLNSDRYFDNITFHYFIYISFLKHFSNDPELIYFNEPHYLVSSISFFVFIKFAYKLKEYHYSGISDFFTSDLYFSYCKYIIRYYNLFYNEIRSIMKMVNRYNIFTVDADYTLDQFNIILRYTMYNKLKNLLNANLKRFLGNIFDISSSMFVDVDDIGDYGVYINKIYENPVDPEDIDLSNLNSIYDSLFKSLNLDPKCKDDITNIAIELCNGCLDFNGYDPSLINAGRKLVDTLRGKVYVEQQF